jgi:hypothetical protein
MSGIVVLIYRELYKYFCTAEYVLAIFKYLSGYGFGMSIEMIILGFIVIVILLILLKKYISAPLYDMYDLVLSFADEPFGGALGFDYGDLVAALLILWKERKITNPKVVFFVAWEATNFFPMGLIPGIGTGLEYFLNFFPAVTIGRILFNKYGAAKTEMHTVESLSEIAFNYGSGESARYAREAKHDLKKLRKKLNDNPVEVDRKEEKMHEKLRLQLEDDVRHILTQSDQLLKQTQERVWQSPEQKNWLNQQVEDCRQLKRETEELLRNEDFENAFRKAKAAEKTIREALEEVASQGQRIGFQFQQVYGN